MKVEFVQDGSQDCPLLRLYDFTSAEVSEVCKRISQLASGDLSSCSLNQIPGVIGIAGCTLELRTSARDIGVQKLPEGLLFQCALTESTWDNVEGLAEPFTESEVQGYQWLDRTSEITLLLSKDGKW